MTLAALLLLSALLAPAQTPPARLLPADDGPQDPSWLAFRRRLTAALQRRDREFVVRRLEPDIKASFGGEEGPQGFVAHWGLDHPAGSRLWEELSAILSLGGRLRRSGEDVEFWAPYTFTDFPGAWDAFEYSVIMAAGVNLRATPDARAPVAARLSFDIVRTPESPGETGWVKVETLAGRSGYVARRYVRSPIDYRACFVKRSPDEWKLRLLVAGD